MEPKSRKVGSSYLEKIGNDFGGKKAAEIGQEAATRYIAQFEETKVKHRPKPYAVGAAIGFTAVSLVTDLGGAREALLSALQQF